jgi:hypothetical protein
MRWPFELALATAKATIPRAVRTWARTVRPFSEEPGRERWTIEQGCIQIQWLKDAGIPITGATVMEVGTGWQPLIPVLYALAGAARVYLTDIVRLVDPASWQHTLGVLRAHTALIASGLQLAEGEVAERLASIAPWSLRGAFAALRLEYLAPVDGRALPLDPASVDVVYSRAVLEHVPPEVLPDLARDWHRVLRQTGVTLHFIDTADHWAFHDPSICYANFLKYPEWLWRWTGLNEQHYQNRWRHPAYMSWLTTHGFTIVRAERTVDPRSLRALSSMRIAPPFLGLAAEDLASIETRVLARPHH